MEGWFDEAAACAAAVDGCRKVAADTSVLAIITGLWETPEGGKFSFSGAHYTVTDSPGLPKPAQRPRPPVLIGGTGKRRTPQLAVRYADEYNVPFNGVLETAAAFGRVRDACAAAGRDASSMTYSSGQVVCCGRSQAELERRAASIGRDLAELREGGVAGTPAEVAEKIARYSEIGAQRMYLQVLDLQDFDHLELIAAEVAPRLD